MQPGHICLILIATLKLENQIYYAKNAPKKTNLRGYYVLPAIYENDLTVNNQIPTYENIYEEDTSKLELTTKILMKKFNLLHQVHSPEQIAQASAATNVTTSTLVELEL